METEDSFVIKQPEFVIKLGTKNKLQMGYNHSLSALTSISEDKEKNDREEKRLQGLRKAQEARRKKAAD